jgi:hypothetical protein
VPRLDGPSRLGLAEGTYSKRAVFRPPEKHEQLAQSRAPGPATTNPWNPAHSLGFTPGPCRAIGWGGKGSRGGAVAIAAPVMMQVGPSCESAKIDVGA